MTNPMRQLKPRLIASALSAVLLLPLTLGNAQEFSDMYPDHWAYDAVGELTALGIVTGYPDGRFDGTRAATRYEVAVVASRLLSTLEGTAIPTGTENTTLTEQVEALETALAGAASLAYARRLETRIVALEAALNTQTESETFPAEMETQTEVAPLSPTVTTPGASSAPAPSLGETAESGIQFSSRPAHPFYVGISPGVVSTAGDVYLSLQTGYDGLLGAVGPVVRLTFNGGERELRFAVDALAKADLLVEELKLYAGLGLGATLRPGGESLLLEAPFGGEFYITDRASLFLQLTTSYGFAPISDVGAELTTGINLRF